MNYNLDFVYENVKFPLQEAVNVSYYKDIEMGAKSYYDSKVLPCKINWADGGIVDKKNVFVNNSGWRENVKFGYEFNKEGIIVSDHKVIYIGVLLTCWGHAITDNLKKIWFLFTDEYKSLISEGAYVTYVTDNGKDLPEYILKIFTLAGVDTSVFKRTTTITQYKEIIIPSNSLVSTSEGLFYTKEFVFAVRRIKRNLSLDVCSCDTPKKVYFSRSKLNGFKDNGECDVEKVFKRKGFCVIYPEKCSLEEQFALLNNCDEFATTEGSVSHNVIFCRPNTKVVIIRKCSHINHYQLVLNEMSNIDVTYIDAHKSVAASSASPWNGPFYIYVNSKLEEWAGYRILHLPLLLKPSWWLYKYKIYDTNIWRRLYRRYTILFK